MNPLGGKADILIDAIAKTSCRGGMRKVGIVIPTERGYYRNQR